jgi:hypothetical protein
MTFKDYIASEMIGKKLHFKCSCLVPLDHDGVIVGYNISSNEIVFDVEVNGKIITIGENHPGLEITEI